MEEESGSNLSDLCRLCGAASTERKDLRSDELAAQLQNLRFEPTWDDGLPCGACPACVLKLAEVHDFVAAMKRTDDLLRALLATSKEPPDLSFLDAGDTQSLCLEEPEQEQPESTKKRKSSSCPGRESKKPKRESSICEKLAEMSSKMKETEELNAKLNLPGSSGCLLEMIGKNQSKPRGRIQLDSSETSIRVCEQCNIMFSRPELLEQHRGAEHLVFQCQVCGANFNTALILASHLKRNVHRVALKDTKWTCAECFMVCKDKGSMLEHVRSVHTNERPFPCHLCERRFAVKRALTLHVREHKKDWSHVCRFCGKGFLIKEYCEIHVRRYHTNERPFQCDRCEAKYASKLQLSEHIIAKHEGGRPEQIFTCQVCKKKFKGSTGFKYHVQTHDVPLDERKKFKCELCDAAFIRKPALIKHVKRHKGEQEMFECRLCGKKLATAHGLELHLVVHSGEKNHVCEFCGKAFAAAGTLKVHIRSHTGEKPYQCKFCPKKFSQRSSIKVHMRNVHQYEDTVDKLNMYLLT
ncbi:zinc finger protein OZF-like isoform X2 [Cloeon dipterum]